MSTKIWPKSRATAFAKRCDVMAANPHSPIGRDAWRFVVDSDLGINSLYRIARATVITDPVGAADSGGVKGAMTTARVKLEFRGSAVVPDARLPTSGVLRTIPERAIGFFSESFAQPPSR